MPRIVLFALLTVSLVAATSGRAQVARGEVRATVGSDVEDGFTSLFNGKDLTGWRYTSTPKESLEGKIETPDGRIEVKDGIIVVNEKDTKGKGGIKDLYTVKDFGTDFILRMEFRAAPKADSGVYIRGPQLQVRDYPTVGPYKPKGFKTGDWNLLEITVKGNYTTTSVNGKALSAKDVLNLTVKDGKPSARLNGKEIDVSSVDIKTGCIADCRCNGEVLDKAFKVPAKGGIGLQAETGKFEFRKIRIKTLN